MFSRDTVVVRGGESEAEPCEELGLAQWARACSSRSSA